MLDNLVTTTCETFSTVFSVPVTNQHSADAFLILQKCSRLAPWHIATQKMHEWDANIPNPYGAGPCLFDHIFKVPNHVLFNFVVY